MAPVYGATAEVCRAGQALLQMSMPRMHPDPGGATLHAHGMATILWCLGCQLGDGVPERARIPVLGPHALMVTTSCKRSSSSNSRSTASVFHIAVVAMITPPRKMEVLTWNRLLPDPDAPPFWVGGAPTKTLSPITSTLGKEICGSVLLPEPEAPSRCVGEVLTRSSSSVGSTLL